jgi:putative ABC transport system ATP-binding protein
MLDMRCVRKVYAMDCVETHALRQLDLRIEAGEMVALRGPSGSGKSTFLSIAGLLETATSGTYLLDGEDVTHLDDRRRSRLRNRKIGFVFQGFNLVPDLDVQRNVDLPLLYAGLRGRERRRIVHDCLERVGMAGRARHYPHQLSGGQQQRTAIARALAGRPKLLLADEPTGNLDSEMAQGVMALIEDLHREGATIVLATHDEDVAARARRQLRIVDGTCIELAGA